MFQQLAALTSLMKNAGGIQRQMEEMKEKLSRTQVDGRSTCGRVVVTMTGKMDVIAVKFANDPHEIGSKNGVEALVMEAVNNAIRQAKNLAATEMQAVAGNLGLPAEMLEKLGGFGG